MRRVCLLALAACGRIGFDHAGSGSDVADARPHDVQQQACGADTSCFAFESSGSCYQICTTLLTRTQADAACRAWGGCLVALDVAGEGPAVATQNAAYTGNDVWVGLSQSLAGTEPGGGWSWDCSAGVDFRWSGSQPDDSMPPEVCGMLHSTTGGFTFDAPCDWLASYICER